MEKPEPMTVENRYKNLALINMGEALTEFGNVSNRGGSLGPNGGDYAKVKLSLLKAIAALEQHVWEVPAPQAQD